MKVRTAFIAAGGNRHPSAADWDAATGVVAFGAGRNIALWKPLDEGSCGITSLLSGHDDVINALKFTTANSFSGSVLLSGAGDGTIILWLQRADGGDYKKAAVLKEHGKAVNSIVVLPEAGIFVSGAADGGIRCWTVDVGADGTNVEVKCILQHTLTPKFFPLAMAVATLPTSSSIIVAIAGSRNFLQLHTLDLRPSSPPIWSHIATIAGHEAWIRSLDFTLEDPSNLNSDLLLASASQDKYIRLWRIHKGEDLPELNEAAKDPLLGSIGKSLSNKAYRFTSAEGVKFSATFEALLLGHEDWIFSAQWQRLHPPATNGHTNGDGKHVPKLLTASADNSLAVWEPDPLSGVWICTVRLGELSAQKGATTATGSAGGFWIGMWSPTANAVISLGRTGGWRLWKHGSGESDEEWTRDVAVTGHTKEVQAVAWARDGSYLLSTSADQTTRLFAQWRRGDRTSWHEFARPQIHGYDLNCVDTLGNTRFISGADEKLLRVFDEPKAVADVLSQLCGIKSEAGKTLPDAANIPVLGLSNKAVDIETDGLDDEDDALDPSADQLGDHARPFSALDQKHPPTEDTLSRSLLFPEVEKLYGHGHEISALATNTSGGLAATACRASSVDHAVIRLYDTDTWRQLEPPLAVHSLTVTALQFSPSGQWLVSVGRDRACAVWGNEGDKWSLVVAEQKAHSRMLLDISWAPRAAGDIFATAGRDKNVHVWRLAAGTDKRELKRVAIINAALPVTAIAFLQRLVQGMLLLAYALEDGSVHIARLEAQDLEAGASQQEPLPAELVPSMAVTQMAWRPKIAERGAAGEGFKQSSDTDELAVASEDGSLRVYGFDLVS